MTRPRLLGISGSLRTGANSTAILTTLANLVADRADLTLHSIADVPLYNGDFEGDKLPDSVRALKAAIAGADGLVLISPEYNYGISGVLKNALDWASRPAFASPLKGKPVLMMTSSAGPTGGVRAQQQLRTTLAATLSRAVACPEVAVPAAASKIENGELTDETSVKLVLAAFDELMNEVARLHPAADSGQE
ncbi:MAG: NADPH-dependent FMN reductase [Sphingobium sp.]